MPAAALCLRWAWTVFLALLGVAAQAQRVYVVNSDSSPAFAAATDALLLGLNKAGIATLEVRQLRAQDVARMDWPADDGHIIVTLGNEALRQVLARNPPLPVLAALIPRQGYERISAAARRRPGSLGALYLDQPFTRQLDLLHLAMPGTKVVGVIWGPDAEGAQPLLASAARARGMAIKESSLQTSGSLASALHQAIEGADILLAVPDTQVYNPATATDILLTTYRARIPVFVFAPAYVKAGAMLSLHTSPEQVGAQAAQLAHTYLQSGVLPAAQYPQDFTISINEYVARSLGLALDAKNLTAQLRAMEKRP